MRAAPLLSAAMAAVAVAAVAGAPAAAAERLPAGPPAHAATVPAGRGAAVPPATTGPTAAALWSGPRARTAGPDGSPPPLRAGAAVPASAPSGTAPRVTLQGHGYGNGVGMGQWGAFGYATLQHRRWQWIVRHYYGRTYLEPLAASVDAADIAVHLVELDGSTITDVSAVRSGATLQVNGGRRGRTDGVTHTGIRKVVTATAGDVSVDLPGIGWRDYPGSIVVLPNGQTWNEVPLEEYVAGVIPSESPASWGAVPNGEAALQAQAVAARSYALAYVSWQGGICDDDWCQVYAGDQGRQPITPYHADVRRAASTTAGEVMCTVRTDPCPMADVATTQFGASTGGWTEAAAPFPAVADAGDAVAGNPFHTWSTGGYCQTEFPASEVAAAAGLSDLTGAYVSRRSGGDATWGGHAVTVVLSGHDATGATRSVSMPASAFAADLGLCSTWFRFVRVGT